MFNRLTGSSFHRSALAACLATSLAASAVAAQTPPPLNQEQHINDSLIAAAIGELIMRRCDSISPRYLVVYTKVKALEKYARDLGYTEEEVEVFLDDKDEKRRVRRAALDYLAEQGAVKGDDESYCVVGRSEIEKGTLTGQMLWSTD